MPAQTPHTSTDPAALLVQLPTVRELGYALDEGEHGVGVRCVAVPVTGQARQLAVSASGPSPRMTAELVERAVAALREAGRTLSAGVAERPSARDRGLRPG